MRRIESSFCTIKSSWFRNRDWISLQKQDLPPCAVGSLCARKRDVRNNFAIARVKPLRRAKDTNLKVEERPILKLKKTTAGGTRRLNSERRAK